MSTQSQSFQAMTKALNALGKIANDALGESKILDKWLPKLTNWLRTDGAKALADALGESQILKRYLPMAKDFLDGLATPKNLFLLEIINGLLGSANLGFSIGNAVTMADRFAEQQILTLNNTKLLIESNKRALDNLEYTTSIGKRDIRGDENLLDYARKNDKYINSNSSNLGNIVDEIRSLKDSLDKISLDVAIFRSSLFDTSAKQDKDFADTKTDVAKLQDSIKSISEAISGNTALINNQSKLNAQGFDRLNSNGNLITTKIDTGNLTLNSGLTRANTGIDTLNGKVPNTLNNNSGNGGMNCEELKTCLDWDNRLEPVNLYIATNTVDSNGVNNPVKAVRTLQVKLGNVNDAEKLEFEKSADAGIIGFSDPYPFFAIPDTSMRDKVTYIPQLNLTFREVSTATGIDKNGKHYQLEREISIRVKSGIAPSVIDIVAQFVDGKIGWSFTTGHTIYTYRDKDSLIELKIACSNDTDAENLITKITSLLGLSVTSPILKSSPVVGSTSSPKRKYEAKVYFYKAEWNKYPDKTRVLVNVPRGIGLSTV
jgi:hypothetical protein